MNEWNHDEDTKPSKPNFFMRWIQRIFRWARNFFAFVGFIYTAIPVILIWSFFHFSDSAHKPKSVSGKESKEPFTLWLTLDSGIMEHEPYMGEELLRQFLGNDDGIYLPSIRSALRNASSDKDVKDLNLVLDGLSGSLADLEELRQIILEFKSGGKNITSWVTHMDNAAMLIASATDKIHLNPVAEVSLPGPAFSMPYFGDALRRLGIEMQVIKTGKFKSAFEPFIANEPSQENKEALGSIERSIRDHLVKMVAQGRKKQDAEVFLWFKESFFTPAKAKELGIVDELAYVPTIDFESSTDRELDDYGSDESLGAKLSKGYSLRPDDGLGLIEAVGEISESPDGERNISPSAIDEELSWAMTDDNVKAVVLRIASPGGSASASDVIWNRVRALNEIKPVIVSMGSVAASGGYYIASAAKTIVADPATITGSIGVIGMLPGLDGMQKQWGLSFHTITQSNRSAILSSRKMTPSDYSYLQATIDDVYRTFKSRVSAGRKISMERVEQLAQGRVYTGLQAKDNGLVDELGSLKDAIQIAKKAAGFDVEKLYPVHRFEPRQLTLSECISSMSKFRRCFRHHGSNVKAEAYRQFLNADKDIKLELETVKSIRNWTRSDQRVLAVLPERLRI